MTPRWLPAALVAALAVGTATAIAAPARAAATAGCGAEVAASPNPAGTLRAGHAVARGVFATYGDTDTVLDGGTVVPPDLSSPVAEVTVDRTGLGTALASPLYSPYSDAAGLPNAFAGTELPLGGISEPSRAKVTGRPPQQQDLAFAGGPGSSACVRLHQGPLAEAAARATGLSDGLAVRVGDVHALAGPKGAGSETSATVVLVDVAVGELHIEQVVLSTAALADGSAGRSAAASQVSGITLAGQAMRLTPAGFEPVGGGAPDAAALAAPGIELVSAGTARHSSAGGRSVAHASGPILRVTSPDGRVVTLVLGEASADAQLERVG